MLSVYYLCRGHTWLESDFSFIPKCHGNSGDVTLVWSISIGVSFHLHTVGAKSLMLLYRKLNWLGFE